MTQQYLENEISELKTRLKIVEDNLNGLIVMVGKLRSNTNDDINGTRQSVANITPYTETKKAYYGDTEITFYSVPKGNVTVFFSDYDGGYNIRRVGSRLIVAFYFVIDKPSIDVTISITQ